MTIAALLGLLEEIDAQGGPEAARQNRLQIPAPDEGPTMTQPVPKFSPTPAGPSAFEPQPIPVGQLLKWGDDHSDPDVQDQAARARVSLTGLRRRHAADQELAAITTEAEALEQRLAELRAREQQLTPTKPKKQRKPVDYPAAAVRAWAEAHGIGCPPVGRVPKAVVEAWRAAGQPGGEK